MKILVVGKGGREHALLTRLQEVQKHHELYCFPGSDAISKIAHCIEADDLHGLVYWMKKNKIELCIVGEETYLVEQEGLANLCEKEAILCWGPNKESAQLEASKIFAKKFMQTHSIPTARATSCKSIEEARNAIKGKYPTVLKFDGLAAGKGVAVCAEEKSSEAFLKQVLVDCKFGVGNILVEEHLTGSELSIIAAVSDGKYQIFAPTRDYKRIGNYNQGANTGGMGAVASPHLIDQQTLDLIEKAIVRPSVEGLVAEAMPYRGFLYFGIILTDEGPKMIEYNCRLGDPECQALMPLLQGDFASYLYEAAKGVIKAELISFEETWSVCLILASAGYPESSSSGDPISGLKNLRNARVYHSGTRINDSGNWETNGGRVLSVVAQGATRQEAVLHAYTQADRISFPEMQKRKDIGTTNFF